MKHLLPTIILACLTLARVTAFEHLEPRQQQPIALTPDGATLLALHSTAHTLSVFDVGSPPRTTPLLIAEIAVGTAPVTVRPRNNLEAWVVNSGADSISIVCLAKRAVIDTLRVGDEPADICFAAGKAFVTCGQDRTIHVFDAVTRFPLGQIEIDGVAPRSLVASHDGSKLFVACLLSGNGTTILPKEAAPAQPAPTNPALPAPPQTALIVPADDPRITWNVLDHDIAEIDTATHTITRWISGVGTNLFHLAMHPVDGSLWCANTDLHNLTRFESELNGHFATHRLTRIAFPAATLTHHDLNPGIVRHITPHPPSIALALAQPTSSAFNGDGTRAWIAAFNSDRVAEIDTATGEILQRIDLRPPGAGSAAMRGPRALAMAATRLYVLNKISDTLTTLHPANGGILSEISLGSIDPMPASIRSGRGLLYDARTSGNGTISCATCHIDADRDGLAWDLGDPAGEMLSVTGAALSIHASDLIARFLHPMKGPLTTQTLRGLATNDADPIDPTDGTERPAEAIVTKFHWRGDKPSIESFNSTFPNLMGGHLQPAAEMQALAAYLRSIIHPPNPNLNLDRTLPTDHPKGNAVRGRSHFLDHDLTHCVVCHSPPAGTDQNIDDPFLIAQTQPFKNPSLRTVYQRAGIFNPLPGQNSLSGFGLGADGSDHELPTAHPYDSLSLLHNPPFTANKLRALDELTAFILSFDTGTAPSACHDLTLTAHNRTHPDLLAILAALENGANSGQNGLVAHATLGGVRANFRWVPGQNHYLAADGTTHHTREELLGLLENSDALTFHGVLPSETAWRSTDRNGDGTPDLAEPMPSAQIERAGNALHLQWPKGDWFPVRSPDLSPPWHPAPGDPISDGASWLLPLPHHSESKNFYRLQRTW